MKIQQYDTHDGLPLRPVSYGLWVKYDDAYKNNKKAYLHGFIAGAFSLLAGVILTFIF